MSMVLRPYQEELLAGVVSKAREGHRCVLAVLSTGGGKTVIAASLALRTRGKGTSIWFLCHRDFLIHQTAVTFAAVGVDHGYIAAGLPMLMQPRMICSVDTLRSRLDTMTSRPDVIVWDEAHHLRAAGWEKIRNWAGERCHHIGLTATPERLDGKGLAPPFTAMVLGPSTAELIKLGCLSGYRAYAPTAPDLAGVGTVAGDFNAHQLTEAVTKSVITGDVVKHYMARAQGRRAVYFCVSIEYSKHLAEMFKMHTVAARHVDGETSTEDRISAARAFARGDIKVLTNCSLFGEGYDLAAQAQADVTIDVVGLVRPTQSLALHLQQIGRCLRPKPEPAIILDHAGNISRHGLPDEDRVWSLDGRKQRDKKPSEVKMCRVCFAMNPVYARTCVACGEPFAGMPREAPEHRPDELVELDVEAIKRARRQEVWDATSYEEMAQIGRRRGYKPTWAWHAWNGERERRRQLELQAAAQRRR